MSGRKPMPFSLVDNKKSKISNAELEKRENAPIVCSNAMRPPTHLSAEAKKEWKKIIKLYKELELPIINDLDKNSMEIYCNAIVMYRRALNAVERAGAVALHPKSGLPVINPWHNIMKIAAETCQKYSAVLLLDPISRARIGVANAKAEKIDDEDPMMKLLGEIPRYTKEV